MFKSLGRLLVPRNKLTCVFQGEQRRHLNVRSNVHFQASKNRGPLSGSGSSSRGDQSSGSFFGNKNKNSANNNNNTGTSNQGNKFGKANKANAAATNNSFFADRMSGKNRSSRRVGGKSSTADLQSTGVQHDKRNCRYTLDLGNNQVAHIDYKVCGPNCIELYETFVPEELRGRGIAKVLARGVLDQASSGKLKVKLTCTYLVDYFNKFADPKYKNLLQK